MKLALATLALAGAQDARPGFEETVAPSGARVWAFPDDGGDRFVLQVLVGSGSRDEAPEHAGIAHFLEHVLLTSTELRSKRGLDEAADEHGCAFNGTTSQEFTTYEIECSSSAWRFAVDWLVPRLARPPWRVEDVDAERRIVAEEIDLRNPHAGVVTFESVLYADHALGRDIAGDVRTLTRIETSDLVAFHAAHYRAANIAVGFAGRVPREECVAAILAALEGVPEGDAPARDDAIRPKTGTLIFGGGVRERSSGHVRTGFHLPAASARELAAQLVIRAYTSERFFDEVREKRQLSYAPEVELEHFSDVHRLDFSASVSDESNLPEVVAICDALVAELRAPDERRIELACAGASMELEVNSLADMRSAMRLAWLVRERGESPRELIDAIESLVADDVAAYAKTHFTPGKRFLISNSLALRTGWRDWIAFVVLALVLVGYDGYRGFPWARAVGERWREWRRKFTTRRNARPAARKLTPVNPNDLEKSFHRYFEEEDKKRGPRGPT